MHQQEGKLFILSTLTYDRYIYIHSGATKEKLEVRSKSIYYCNVRCIVTCPIILSINFMRPKYSFIWKFSSSSSFNICLKHRLGSWNLGQIYLLSCHPVF